MPVVTAVVPLYNKALYIERCLRSIQAQSFADFEVVVVDDGSSDHSGEIASQAVRSDPRFRIIVQTNRGEGAARNRGIQEARTGLVAFLDGDDEWEPGFLEAIMDLAQQFPEAGILATGFSARCVDGSNPQITLAGTGRKLLHDYFRRAKVTDIVWPSASAVPAKVLREVGGFAEGVPLGADRDLWGRIALRYPVAHDNRILAVYHKEATGRVCDTYARTIRFPIAVRSLRAELAKGSVPPNKVADVKAYMDHLQMQYAEQLLYQGDRAELGRVLKEEPFYLKRYRFEALLLRSALPLMPTRLIHALRKRPLMLIRSIRQL